MVKKIQHVDNRIDIDESNLTPIQEFYKNTNIFVTGFTGFLGQILVEKLLRSCPVSTIYLLIRPKKGKDVETRLKEILDHQLFNRMKKACPDYRKKIVAIEGDCTLAELRLGIQDKKLLVNEVDIVFHVAATVRFDENLKTATAINVTATRDLSKLAGEMKNLKSFIQVSTAFCNCVNNVIEEKVYPTPMDYKYLIKMTESVDGSLLEKITPYYLGKWPNTYVYTKQIAEDVIKQETKGFASGIYRPSIVVSTYKEPIRGWINNVYGANGVLVGSGLGLLRVVCGDKDNYANIVPVDLCVNGLISSAWDVTKRFARSKEENEEFEIPVYNHDNTNNDKVMVWSDFRKMTMSYGAIIGCTKSLWKPILILITSHKLYLIAAFFLHTVPAFWIDVILFLAGKKTRMMKIYKKVHHFSEVTSYFINRKIQFKSANLRKMVSEMAEKDRDIFFCELDKMDWNDFFSTYVSGARVYLLDDPLETIAEGKVHQTRLKWIHNITMMVIGVLATVVLWYMLSITYRCFI